MIKIFYDGKCGLCSKEINYYMKIAPKNTFLWYDITQNQEILKEEQIELKAALKILHVKDKKGNLKLGIDGFIVIWSALPKWHILSKIIALPIIKQGAKISYFVFAKYRYNETTYCTIKEK